MPTRRVFFLPTRRVMFISTRRVMVASLEGLARVVDDTPIVEVRGPMGGPQVLDARVSDGTAARLRPLRGPGGLALAQALATLPAQGRLRDMPARLWQALLPRSFYRAWAARRDGPRRAEAGEITVALARLPALPRYSLFMMGPASTGLSAAAWMAAVRRTADSLGRQIHDNWELLLPPDGPLMEMSDPRARPWNPAAGPLDGADGAFVALLAPGDTLPRHALALCTLALDQNPATDILYTDEEWSDRLGQPVRPILKPAFDPDLLYGAPTGFPGQLTLLRADLARKVVGTDQAPGTLDRYRLLLEAVQATPHERIRHLPRVLLRRAAPPPLGAAKTLQSFLDRHQPGAQVQDLPTSGGIPAWRVHWPLPDPAPVVSLIVPTRDRLDLLRPCMQGLLADHGYPATEIIIIDHECRDPDMVDYLAALKDRYGVRVLPYRGAFNYPDMLNRAAVATAGEVLVFLHNDVEPRTQDWLREVVSQALRPGVGAVGAKLLRADGSLQHGGLVLGLKGKTAGCRNAGQPGRAPVGLAAAWTDSPCVQRVSAVSGACLTVRRDLFDAAGGFDAETYRLSNADLDLCLRLNQMGHATVWTPFAELTHVGAIASKGAGQPVEVQERIAQDHAAFRQRWAVQISQDRCWNPALDLNGAEGWLALPGLSHGPISR